MIPLPGETPGEWGTAVGQADAFAASAAADGRPAEFDMDAVSLHDIAEFQIRVARERLGIGADVMPGGHLVAKSRPLEVAARLMKYDASRA